MKFSLLFIIACTSLCSVSVLADDGQDLKTQARKNFLASQLLLSTAVDALRVIPERETLLYNRFWKIYQYPEQKKPRMKFYNYKGQEVLLEDKESSLSSNVTDDLKESCRLAREMNGVQSSLNASDFPLSAKGFDEFHANRINELQKILREKKMALQNSYQEIDKNCTAYEEQCASSNPKDECGNYRSRVITQLGIYGGTVKRYLVGAAREVDEKMQLLFPEKGKSGSIVSDKNSNGVVPVTGK